MASCLHLYFVSDYDLLNVGRKIFKSYCLLNVAALSFNFEQIYC